MTQVQAITDIRTAMKAGRLAWTGGYTLDVKYDSLTSVDVSLVVNPFVCCEIVFLDAHQMALGGNPPVMQYGQIHLGACVKVGQTEATLKAMRLLDYFTPLLELKNWTLVRTRASAAHKSYTEKGWECWPILVPFWYQRIAVA